MRSFLTTSSVLWASALILPSITITTAMSAPIPLRPSMINVQQYDIDNAFTRFELSGSGHELLTSPLVFELRIPPADDGLTSHIVVNGQDLELAWTRHHTTLRPDTEHSEDAESRPRLRAIVATQSLTEYPLVLPDVTGVGHNVTFSMGAAAGDQVALNPADDGIQERFKFRVTMIDGQESAETGFFVHVRPYAERRLRSILSLNSDESIDFDQFSVSFTTDALKEGGEASNEIDQDFDIEAEIASLVQLEAEAEQLRAKIASKKQAIASNLRHHRDHVSLHHLLEQCDGIMCAAKVIAQRICDKVGIQTEPSFKYVHVQSPVTQHLLGIADDELPQKARNCTKSKLAQMLRTGKHEETTASMPQPLMLAELSEQPSAMKIDFSHPADALIKVLEIIASAFGLVALVSFLHRKFMPMRKRVERDADREERRNARAYRRAARRADVRARWVTFLRSINCFKQQDPPSNGNYEEKRALIIQDAFLEQDLESAEKGEIMEAEIRELRHAQELVASMVRGGEHRYDLITPVADPPPSLVPLPFTPATRSRASTGTLPSYTSESLPEYLSRVDCDSYRAGATTSNSSSRSSSVVDGFPHYSTTTSSGSDEEAPSQNLSTAPSEVGSRRSRYTLLSSVLETSPRVSAETLRTRYSKDTRYSREL